MKNSNKANKNNKLPKKVDFSTAIRKADPRLRDLYTSLLEIESAVSTLNDLSLYVGDSEELMKEYLQDQDDDTVIRFLELHDQCVYGIVSLTVDEYKSLKGIEDDCDTAEEG